jgi:hypothetical protein
MGVGMSAEQDFFRGRLGRSPFPVRMAGFQQRERFPNSVRSLRMPRRGVFDAPRIVKNNHSDPSGAAVTNKSTKVSSAG